MPRRWNPWTTKDLILLRRLWADGCNIKFIARQLDRTPDAVMCMRKRLKFPARARRKKERQTATLSILLTPAKRKAFHELSLRRGITMKAMLAQHIDHLLRLAEREAQR
jgi:hypothetical protein